MRELALFYHRILSIEPKADRVKVRLRWHIKPKLYDEVAYFVPPDSLVIGKIMRVSKQNRTAIFLTDDKKARVLLNVNRDYLLVTRYYLAQVVLDSERHWTHVMYEPRESVEGPVELPFDGPTRVYPEDGGARCVRPKRPEDTPETLPPGFSIVTGGWTHEHCFLCWAEICKCCNPSCYVDDDDTWLCETCYESYVRKKNLSFLSNCWPYVLYHPSGRKRTIRDE